MMSGWKGNLSQSLNHALEIGRRGSIDLLTRLGAESRGSQQFSRNRRTDKVSTDPANKSPRPMPKNHSAPIMQNLLAGHQNQEIELTMTETKTLWAENLGRLPGPRVARGKKVRKEQSIIPMPKIIEDSDSKMWQRHGNNHLGLVLSALYAKLLVVCGTGFALAEVISSYIPVAFYDGFYLYLYLVSILFMTGILGHVVKEKAHRHAKNFAQEVTRRSQRPRRTTSPTTPIHTGNDGLQLAIPKNKEMKKSCSEYSTSSLSDSGPSSSSQSGSTGSIASRKVRARNLVTEKETRGKGTHFGSFYLRIGAVAFGVGSMIYTGLEFGQFFELKTDEACHNYMAALLTPIVKMIFTFMQMYFIFLNSKMGVSEVSLMGQFGLMHMIGTNLCIWLNVLVQETKHEILNFYDPNNKTISFRYEKAHKAYLNVLYDQDQISPLPADETEQILLQRMRRGLKGPHTIMECGRTDIMGSIVQDSSPFLFPCTIEFSLICAAVCFVMWKNFAKRRTARVHREHGQFSPSTNSRSPHHYSVDCARANKGLFVGIFFLVLTIMSIIINLVLDTREEYKDIANLEVNITEIVLYSSASIAVLIGMYQVRVLRYAKQRNLELDNILLIVAQTGSLIFNVFTIISGQFKGEKLVLILALSKVVQLLLQTLFILDASNRQAATAEQAKRKPGREVVTYLLVTNLAMWLMNALEKSRGESHPSQLQFYGVWGWTIITHISMPLAIFYRFHSTVCLCEIWKRAFKLKRT